MPKRECDVETLNDFSRYYTSSWVGWHDKDKDYVTPISVSYPINEESIGFRPLSRELTVGPAFGLTLAQMKEQIDFGVPDIGMIPEGPTIKYHSYTTPRAPSKGFRPRNLRNYEFNSWDIRKKYQLDGNEYARVFFAFNPSYSTLSEAEVKLVEGSAVGVALSRTLGVYSSPKYVYSLLAYKRWTVGHILSPYLIQLKEEFSAYEEDISKQTGAEVIVR